MFRTPPVVIHESATFRVVSYGNGAAYAFDNTAERRGVLFQGEDDAEQFRADLDRAYYGHPNWLVEDTLRHLWSDLEYGLAAAPWDAGRDPVIL